MDSNIPTSAQVVVCGAGIAGISAAFHLSRLGISDIVVVDERAPLTLTSDKSTECYRDWWPTKSMVSLMSRSIDLLETYADESDNRFSLSRRGYLYLTADTMTLDRMASDAARISQLGVGEVRTHSHTAVGYIPAHLEGYDTTVDGADLFTDRESLTEAFGYLSGRAAGGLHVRRAGWLSAQQLGAWMIEQTSESGVHYVRATVTAVDSTLGSVRSVTVDESHVITCQSFINAAGPLVAQVGALAQTNVPVGSEIHQKVSFKDHKGGFPREAPMVIWSDPQRIEWPDDVRGLLHEAGRGEVTHELPPFVHGRPEGGVNSDWALALWEWRTKTVDTPTWPLDEDPLYPELVLRGLAAALPDMALYSEGLPEHAVDGGYYTKTVENTPIIGPIGPQGSYICAALSGYGVMVACAAGELVALHVARRTVPDYAAAFDIRRYDDPHYVRAIASLTDTGQI